MVTQLIGATLGVTWLGLKVRRECEWKKKEKKYFGFINFSLRILSLFVYLSFFHLNDPLKIVCIKIQRCITEIIKLKESSCNVTQK